MSSETKQHEQSVQAWKDLRVKRLTTPDGWLTLCGLTWLEAGDNSVGSDSKSKVTLPTSCPANVGVIHLSDNGKITFTAAQGSGATIQGSAVEAGKAIELKSDAEAKQTVVHLAQESVTFVVIKRDTKLGVRAKDKKNQAYLEFKGIDYYPVSSQWKVDAVYHPYPEMKTMNVVNAVGLPDPQRCPGYLEIKVAQDSHTLDVIDEDGDPDRFWIIYKDQTSGNETYGMRYLYCPRPAKGSKDNKTYIDFNESYNPPCAFTPYATCPYPPKQNHLKVKVEAGEKMYKGGDHH